jgi:uncharacterized protein YwgA
MPQRIDDPAPWILGATEALNRHGSWTGRIHIHKLLFVTQILELAKPPFKFVVHDFGPYSFELDEEIINLGLIWHLDHSYPTPGYGPRYEPTPQGRVIAAGLPDESAKAAIRRVAEEFGDRDSQKLELLATALWAEKKEQKTKDEEIISWVVERKPKYNEEEVRRGLEDARGLVVSLSR